MNEAIILQQIHYWLKINKRTNKNFHNSRYWVYNTYSQWQETFTFFSVSTIKRTFKSLKKQKLIITNNYNKKKYDRTIWYTIDYKQLETLEFHHSVNMTSSTGQYDTMQGVNMTSPIPETTQRLSSETKRINNIPKNKVLGNNNNLINIEDTNYTEVKKIHFLLKQLDHNYIRKRTDKNKIKKYNDILIMYNDNIGENRPLEKLTNGYIEKYKNSNHSIEHFIKTMAGSLEYISGSPEEMFSILEEYEILSR
ncbi:MAG: hypothetical protein U9R54_09085 [Bacteroidota bacterium]|nr:hypothetical protein [Bacteroidota bacterium]